MNKLVGPVCVLLMAGMASAATIDLLVNGGKEITLLPSQTAVIEVVATLQAGESLMGAAWFVLADEDGQPTPTGVPLDFEVIGYSEDLVGWEYDRTGNGPLPIANINETSGEFPVGTWKGLSDVIQDPSMAGIYGPLQVVLSNYIIHCVGLSEDVIYFNTNALYQPIFTGSDWIDYYPTPGDPILLHQVPEPATIGLLALSGLMVLRRRR